MRYTTYQFLAGRPADMFSQWVSQCIMEGDLSQHVPGENLYERKLSLINEVIALLKSSATPIEQMGAAERMSPAAQPGGLRHLFDRTATTVPGLSATWDLFLANEFNAIRASPVEIEGLYANFREWGEVLGKLAYPHFFNSISSCQNPTQAYLVLRGSAQTTVPILQRILFKSYTPNHSQSAEQSALMPLLTEYFALRKLDSSIEDVFDILNKNFPPPYNVFKDLRMIDNVPGTAVRLSIGEDLGSQYSLFILMKMVGFIPQDHLYSGVRSFSLPLPRFKNFVQIIKEWDSEQEELRIYLEKLRDILPDIGITSPVKVCDCRDENDTRQLHQAIKTYCIENGILTFIYCLPLRTKLQLFGGAFQVYNTPQGVRLYVEGTSPTVTWLEKTFAEFDFRDNAGSVKLLNEQDGSTVLDSTQVNLLRRRLDTLVDAWGKISAVEPNLPRTQLLLSVMNGEIWSRLFALNAQWVFRDGPGIDDKQTLRALRTACMQGDLRAMRALTQSKLCFTFMGYSSSSGFRAPYEFKKFCSFILIGNLSSIAAGSAAAPQLQNHQVIFVFCSAIIAEEFYRYLSANSLNPTVNQCFVYLNVESFIRFCNVPGGRVDLSTAIRIMPNWTPMTMKMCRVQIEETVYAYLELFGRFPNPAPPSPPPSLSRQTISGHISPAITPDYKTPAAANTLLNRWLATATRLVSLSADERTQVTNTIINIRDRVLSRMPVASYSVDPTRGDYNSIHIIDEMLWKIAEIVYLLETSSPERDSLERYLLALTTQTYDCCNDGLRGRIAYVLSALRGNPINRSFFDPAGISYTAIQRIIEDFANLNAPRDETAAWPGFLAFAARGRLGLHEDVLPRSAGAAYAVVQRQVTESLGNFYRYLDRNYPPLLVKMCTAQFCDLASDTLAEENFEKFSSLFGELNNSSLTPEKIQAYYTHPTELQNDALRLLIQCLQTRRFLEIAEEVVVEVAAPRGPARPAFHSTAGRGVGRVRGGG